MKKPDLGPALSFGARSGDGWPWQAGALAALQFAEGVAYHLLGEAGTLAALGTRRGCRARQDSLRQPSWSVQVLAVCHTVAQANVHAAGSIE